MKNNVLLIPFIAVLALMVVGFASAGVDLVKDGSDGITVELSDTNLNVDGRVVANIIGDVVPIRVMFDAAIDSDRVEVEVEIEGFREDVSAETSEFQILEGKYYSKLLTLRLPSDIDDNLDDEYTLYVDVVSGDGITRTEYAVSLQRDTFELDVLSVDYTSKVAAGDTVPVSVVVKNYGYENADDNYVIASIPALGISSRGYLGDLVANEDLSNGEEDDDSAFKTVYLKIPENAQSGVYDMEIEVYNDDTRTMVKKLISVGNSDSTMVLATDKNKEFGAGETVTYDIIVVNSANNVRVFNIETVSGDALIVSAPSAIAVGPDATETVSIMVSAAANADVGTYTFSVSVDDKQTVFGANITGQNVSVSLVAWTVVLVVVFVVLLAVLLVLVTRKEKTIEEVETSYY